MSFEKFHNMHAHVRNSQVTPESGCYEFFSYNTKIAEYRTYELGASQLFVSPFFDWSTTTLRQFSRWLNEYNVPIEWHDIRELYKMVYERCIKDMYGILLPNGWIRFNHQGFSNDLSVYVVGDFTFEPTFDFKKDAFYYELKDFGSY